MRATELAAYRSRERPSYRYERGWILDEVRRLSRIDDRRNAYTLIVQWIVLLGAGAVAIAADRWFVYVAAAICIGSRLQFLAVLMHDACHHTLFSNRRVNDIVGDLFVSYPLGIGIDLYRASHLRHHRYTNTYADYDFAFMSSDPDQRFPKTAGGMLWLLAKSLTGLNVVRMLYFTRTWVPAFNLHNPAHLDVSFSLSLRIRYLLWVTVVYGAIILSPWPLHIFGLYLIPLFVWSNVFNRMRAMAEHNGVADGVELNGTRTVIPSMLDRFLIVPFNVSYHLEHHLFPSVPGRNLRRLHERLRSDARFSDRAHITKGYWGVVRELLAPGSVVSTSLPTVRPD